MSVGLLYGKMSHIRLERRPSNLGIGGDTHLVRRWIRTTLAIVWIMGRAGSCVVSVSDTSASRRMSTDMSKSGVHRECLHLPHELGTSR